MSKVYNRVVLKISGESFAGEGALGIHPDELVLIASEIAAAHELNTDIAVVVGGGNIIRGAPLAAASGFDQLDVFLPLLPKDPDVAYYGCNA